MQIGTHEIDSVCDMVNDLCGIYLDESKGYLIESRLSSVAEKYGCDSFEGLVAKVRSRSEREIGKEVINAITTNETLFFRDNRPFEALAYKVIPGIIDSNESKPNPRKLRIWSAACSTGQEPYSIAMTLFEMLPDFDEWDISIFATDISKAAITKASSGLYEEHEVSRGMSAGKLTRFFDKVGNQYRVKDEIRGQVRFDNINLLEPFDTREVFDVVFCRNVLIYFTEEVKTDIVFRLTEKMTPEGVLFVGSSESLLNLGERFHARHHCRTIFYQPNLSPAPNF